MLEGNLAPYVGMKGEVSSSPLSSHASLSLAKPTGATPNHMTMDPPLQGLPLVSVQSQEMSSLRGS